MRSCDVIKNFAAKKGNRSKGGAVEWQSGNVWCRGNAVYSYGSHFPLAYRLEGGKQEVYLLNGDRYSNTTSGHQSEARTLCRPGFTVPFSALRAAGLVPGTLTARNVVERTEDVDHWLVRDSEEGAWRIANEEGVFEIPRVGEVRVQRHEPLRATFHAPGMVLLKQGRDRFLATSDEGTYCIMKLKGSPKTIAEAIEGLQPKEVRTAKENGADVKRQGEWFFVPTTPPEGRSHARARALPRRGEQGNLHVVRQVVRNGDIYVRGVVRHRNPFSNRATRQHRALMLKSWHRAYRNTERGSWQTSGRVD